ncbi:MAG: glycosyltransferase [Phycisphaerae bacterium]
MIAQATRPNLVMIGSYVPRKCGIATFTHDLATALSDHVYAEPLASGHALQIFAMNDRDGEYAYGAEVTAEVRQHRREDYRNAADMINTGRIDVVGLQHEYGLYGGTGGDYVFELLHPLDKPVVTTLHTVLSEPSAVQLGIMQRLCEQSAAVVVMAERARALLGEVYGVADERIHVIPHGVPDIAYGETGPFKARFGVEGRPTVLTFGLLSPGKGIETMLDALAQVVPDVPDVAYIVLGVTHPAVRRESGESYRLSLERRAVELGIQKNVLFHNRYVSLDDLCAYLQAADTYVTPYLNREQIVSGTLAYALASGRAIISTPYWHARELLADDRGRLVEVGDAAGFAENLRALLTNDAEREQVRKAAYAYGRSMLWPKAAAQYARTCEQARTSLRARERVSPRRVIMRMSLPEVRPRHLFTMTDDTGMLQHAVCGTPDRRHGYCIDDNARALIVAAMMWTLFQDERVLPYIPVYLSFLHYAFNGEVGRFRNFMSYDRRWLEADGSDDAQGRALWALGYVIDHSPDPSTRDIAEDLFRAEVAAFDAIKYPRSWAFAILGLHYYLRRHDEDVEARSQLERLARRLHTAFGEHATPDWPWLEDVVTYDNGRLPQALIIAGTVLDRPEMTDRGVRTLRWLLDVQTSPGGHLSVIGNKGWYARSGDRAMYDQQPLEPAALIGACKAAYRASGDTTWLIEMRRCFEWYLGRNDGGLSLVDFKTGGCRDGLKPSAVNRNQGAESVLSWLLSLLIMNEMQTGDAPEIG